MKECQKCGVVQDSSCFVKDKRRKDGLYPYCKDCAKAYYNQTRLTQLAKKKEYHNRPEIKQKCSDYKKEYYLKHRDKYINMRREYYADPENRRKLLLFKVRERAQEAGLECTITVDDIIIPTYCPYLGIELTHDLGKGQLPTNSSVDRIDSTKGYIPGNIQIISRMANTMKNSATMEQLITFSQNVLKIHGIEGSNIQRYIDAICSNIVGN